MGNSTIQKQSGSKTKQHQQATPIIQNITDWKNKKPYEIQIRGSIAILAEHAQNNQFITITLCGCIQIWDTVRKSIQSSTLIKANKLKLNQCQFKSPGKCYGCLTSQSAIRVLAFKTFKQIRKIKNFQSKFSRLVRVSSQAIEFNNFCNELQIWSPDNGELITSPLYTQIEYSEMAYSPNGQYLAYTSVNLDSLIVQDLLTNIQKQANWYSKDSANTTKILQYSPDGNYIVCSIESSKLNLLQVFLSVTLKQLWQKIGKLYQCSFSKDNKFLAISGEYNQKESLIIYNILDGKILYNLCQFTICPIMSLLNCFIVAEKNKLMIYS